LQSAALPKRRADQTYFKLSYFFIEIEFDSSKTVLSVARALHVSWKEHDIQ
jgi:hypothetical protein